MDAEGILYAGERGIHLLFDPLAIASAFEADPVALRDVISRRRFEVEGVLLRILELESAEAARRMIAALPCEIRHVLVLLYFELLAGRLRRRSPVVH